MKAREPEKQSLGVKRREEIGRLQAPRLGKSLQVGKIPTKINFSTGRFLRCPRKNSRLSSAAYWHVACYNLQDENKLGARPHGSRIRQKDWRHRWEAHTLIFVERAIHSQSEPPNGDMSGIAWHSVASVRTCGRSDKCLHFGALSRSQGGCHRRTKGKLDLSRRCDLPSSAGL
jgi:hypothetical protein